MQIDRLELRLLRLPLVHSFETSVGRTDSRLFVLVTVESDGVCGYGECVADADPYYSSETTETAWHIIGDFLAPAVLGTQFDHPRDVYPAMAAVRGHNMAKAAVEMACWDACARQAAAPLHRLLGGTRTAIAAGVSVGIEASLERLGERIEMERAAGYRRVKVKIKPGWDLSVIDFIRARFGDIPLMADANGAYTLSDVEHLARLDACSLMMIEQPLAYDDLRDHACLQRRLRTSICLDESIHSLRAGRDALDLGACRVINIKPGRLGGLRESIALHDLCLSRGVPVWHGGMLESGIGRAHNVHLSTLPGFSLPGDVAASRRYYDPDLIEPPFELEADGTIRVPDGPGIGVTIVGDRVERATLRKAVFKRSTSRA
jgi:O-succinylbenzoate synthase